MMWLRLGGRKGIYGATWSRLTINNNKADKIRRSQKKSVEARCHGYLGKCDVSPLRYVSLSYAAVSPAGVSVMTCLNRGWMLLLTEEAEVFRFFFFFREHVTRPFSYLLCPEITNNPSGEFYFLWPAASCFFTCSRAHSRILTSSGVGHSSWGKHKDSKKKEKKLLNLRIRIYQLMQTLLRTGCQQHKLSKGMLIKSAWINYILRGHEITEDSELVDYKLKPRCWTWRSDLEQVPQTDAWSSQQFCFFSVKKKEQKCTTPRAEEWFLTQERCDSACFNPPSPVWSRSQEFQCFIYKFYHGE